MCGIELKTSIEIFRWKHLKLNKKHLEKASEFDETTALM